MEFPHLGANCSVSDCRTLDFLPVSCSGCKGLFCKDHYQYDKHDCPNPAVKDMQVPVCPLCGAIVPIRPGELPDVRVGHHIDTACRSKPAMELKGKIFSNSCCVHRCNRKEVIPFECSRCRLNFCLAHRNELDHNCQGVQPDQRNRRRISAAGAAATFRAVFKDQTSTRNQQRPDSASPSSNNNTESPQSDCRSRAIQEEEDRQLALALAASLNEESGRSSNQRTSNRDSTCTMC